MNDNELTVETEQRAFSLETERATGSNQPEDNKAMFDREAASRRERGKPVTNGRSEKITLYLTPRTFNRLDDLRKYDEANLQDLLNEAIEVYFKSREDDIRFLQEQEEARRARKAKRAS